MTVNGYTPEQQHLSKLEHDVQYAEEWGKQHCHQRVNQDLEGNRLINSSTKVETPIGKGAYWEGQSGWGFFTQLIVWVGLTVGITIMLCILVGLEFLPPLLVVAAILAFIPLRLIVRVLHGG